MEIDEKELELAKVIGEFKESKLTGKLEVYFKLGRIAGASKGIVVFS